MAFFGVKMLRIILFVLSEEPTEYYDMNINTNNFKPS